MTQNCVNSTTLLIQRVTTSTAAVVTCSTTMPNDDTIPQNTEGTEVLTLAITPTTTTSKLEIYFTAPIEQSAAASGGPSIALFQDSTADAIAGQSVLTSASRSTSCELRHIMTSGTTSSTTFKIRIGANSGTCYVNGDSGGTRRDGGISNAKLTISEYL